MIRKKTKSIFNEIESPDINKLVFKSENNLYTFDKKQDFVASGFDATLYRAFDKDKKVVALKMSDDEDTFERENKCYQMIKQNNICNETILCMIESFVSDNLTYPFVIVLPYLENYLPLNKALKKLENKKQLETIIDRLTTAIQTLHKIKVYHSDINSSNILVRLEPFDVKLIDFGNCRMNKEDPEITNDLVKLEMIIQELQQ